MHKILLTEMNRKSRIVEMWKGTGLWEKCSEARRSKLLATIQKMIEATGGGTEEYAEYVMWLARIIKRGLLSVAGTQGPKRIQADVYEGGHTTGQAIMRAQNDYNAFVGDRTIAFFQMLKTIKEAAEECKNNPKFIEVMDIRKGKQQFNADGTPKVKRIEFKPMEELLKVKVTRTSAAGRQIDRPAILDRAEPAAGSVYDDINKVLAPLGDASRLPKGEKLMTFEDGTYWTFVDQITCRVEGSLGGHCGNADPDAGDSIISLRKPNGVGMGVPAATFIYNKNRNDLSEMKANHNLKPNAEHKYIVELLSKPKFTVNDTNINIKYLKGARALPHMDFSLNDLSEQMFKQLCQKNPTLIKTQIQNAEKVTIEQKLDKEHIKWFNETNNPNTNNQNETNSTIKYMQD
jgi:hypothetical protein